MQVLPRLWASQSLCYFFCAFGIFQSFWSVWLNEQGVSMQAIGVIMGIGAVVRGIVNMLFTPMMSRVLSWMSLLLGSAFLFSVIAYWADVQSLHSIVILTVLLNIALAPLIPLQDAALTKMARLRYFDYGKVRIWGTIGFILGVQLVGKVIEWYSADIIILCVVASLLVNFMWSLTRPAVKESDSFSFPQASISGIGALWKDSRCARMVILVALMQASHGAYYSFSAIWWQSLGFSYFEVGQFWTFSMVVEVAVFALSQRWLYRVSLQSLLYMIGIAVIMRWSLTSFASSVPVILFAQTLHGMTFAASHLVMMRFIQETEPSRAVPLQAAYNGLGMSLFLGAASVAAGWAYALYEGMAFLWMAALGVPALLVKFDKR